jgi:hypothetical protein
LCGRGVVLTSAINVSTYVTKEGEEGRETIAGVATTAYSGWSGMEDSCHQVISTRFIIPRRLNHFFMPNGTYHRAELPICRTEASSILVRHGYGEVGVYPNGQSDCGRRG